MTWVLVILVYVGGFSKGEANAMVSVPGFASPEECRKVGEQAKSDLALGTKTVAFTCLKQTKSKE